MWSIWNEPNQPGWLRPQAQRVGRRTVPTSPRPYREPLSLAEAIAELHRCAGSQFDPVIVLLVCEVLDTEVLNTSAPQPETACLAA